MWPERVYPEKHTGLISCGPIKLKKEITDRRIANGKRTVSKVLAVARRMFGKRGFAETSTSEIIKQAGITRGGLYHHFPSKKDIFKAVFRMAMEEIAEQIQFDRSAPDRREHFLKVTTSFFNACLEPDRLKIVMIDAPSVLGIDEFRKLDKELLTAQLIGYMKYLSDNKAIKPINIETMSHLLAGATNEGVFLISQSSNKNETLREVIASFELLIDSFWI